MPEITIELSVPQGRVPQGGDPDGFIQYINRDLEEFSARLKNLEVTTTKKTPPDRTTGISELFQWLVTFYAEHKEEVDLFLKMVPVFLRGISVAVKNFKLWRKRPKTSKDKDKISVRVVIGNNEISLPAESELIEKFVKDLNDAFNAEVKEKSNA